MSTIASFSVGTVRLGGNLPVIIAGPCVLEGEAHALALARHAARCARRLGLPLIFKASFDKANRTSHASYRGPGLEEGLRILTEIRRRTGLPVTTDVHETGQVEAVAAAVDLLQIPAFLCRQTDLVEACARSGRPTTIKKGQFLAPGDCIALIDKFRSAGGRKLAIIERGTSFGYNNLVVDLRALPLIRSLGVPVIFDGTHAVQMPGGRGNSSGGDSRFVPGLIRAACAMGVEGIFMEIHDDPPRAKSDGANALNTKALGRVLASIRKLHDTLGRPHPML